MSNSNTFGSEMCGHFLNTACDRELTTSRATLPSLDCSVGLEGNHACLAEPQTGSVMLLKCTLLGCSATQIPEPLWKQGCTNRVSSQLCGVSWLSWGVGREVENEPRESGYKTHYLHLWSSCPKAWDKVKKDKHSTPARSDP